MSLIEAPTRIEPARLEESTEAITDLVAELSAAAATLADALHPRTAANLASLVRIMNAYYSNLIEGHNTRPRDIERALAGQFDADVERRNLQLEAAAHVRVQSELDAMAATGRLPEPASKDFILWLHREFYRDAPPEMLHIREGEREVIVMPGTFRSGPGHDVAVGRHAPPSSDRVLAFMDYFEQRYRMDRMGKAGRMIAMAAAHHRLNFIHPFLDGNGRVSRLMSHAMAYKAEIGAHGL
jgi:Fic family protein